MSSDKTVGLRVSSDKTVGLPVSSDKTVGLRVSELAHKITPSAIIILK